MPSVTAIVPTYNRSSYIEECLESLLNQTAKLSQIIVVDDGSEDDTKDRVSQFGKAVQYFYKPNAGKASALNLGLLHAVGQWVWFFDDDDVALPDATERRLAALAGSPNAEWVFSGHSVGTDNPDGRIRIIKNRPAPFDATGKRRYHIFKAHQVFLQSVLVKRSALQLVGLFDETFYRSQDYEMMIRLVRHCKAVSISEPTFIWRDHTGERGTKAYRHAKTAREQVWLQFEQILGQRIRSEVGLGELLDDDPPCDLLDTIQQREALFRRMVVMAYKGLPNEAFEDLVLALNERTQSTPPTLQSTERAAILEAVTASYFLAVLEGTVLDNLTHQAQSAFKTPELQQALGIMVRGLAYAIRTGKITGLRRLQLLKLSAKLSVIAGLNPIINAYRK